MACHQHLNSQGTQQSQHQVDLYNKPAFMQLCWPAKHAACDHAHLAIMRTQAASTALERFSTELCLFAQKPDVRPCSHPRCRLWTDPCCTPVVAGHWLSVAEATGHCCAGAEGMQVRRVSNLTG